MGLLLQRFSGWLTTTSKHMCMNSQQDLISKFEFLQSVNFIGYSLHMRYVVVANQPTKKPWYWVSPDLFFDS